MSDPSPAAVLDADALADWFAREARDLPWRHPDFGAWGILVSEFMLQQTPVVRVIPRLREWLQRWPAPADLAAAPASEALRAWDRLGYPRRALALHTAARQIVERHDGVVPDDVPSLLALAGVGDYTARAVAVFAYGKREPVVDTNIRRVIARAAHGLAEPLAPAKRDLAEMAALLPADRRASVVFNAAMMELGALVCTARTPDCGRCPIADGCAWLQSGRPPRMGPPPRRQAAFEGSDRQARGRMLAALRSAETPLPRTQLLALIGDPAQAERALTGLLADGLAVPAVGAADAARDAVTLPGD